VYPNLRSSGLVEIARDVLRTRTPLRVDDFWYGDARVPQSAWEFTIFPLTNQCVGVAFQNVTERRLAAEALSASEELNRLILQAVPAGIVQVDRDGRIVSANAEALEFLGFGVDALATRVIDDFWFATFWEDGTACPADEYPLSQCLETNLPQPPVTIGVRRPDGTLRWAVFSAVPLPDPEIGDCRGAVATFLDITERKRSEEQTQELQKELAHVSRLSTMGEMASGLAHELNQPLAAIIAYADACHELVESGRIVQGQLIEVLRAVSSQADRAGKIIHRLRKLVKKSEPVRAPIFVNDAVREVASLLETEARNVGSYVRLELDEQLPSVPADFIQIQQVLLNLMRNGLDAMADTEPGNRELAIYTRRSPEGHVEVAIRDRGRGVARENVSRLFEPFFTTKPEGLGMGLSISRTIVEAHGGRMWLTPNADAGMTVRLVLPATEAGVFR
jgi:two-component system sensor histidine kinase TtrS